jgi:chromosome partitioning protein
MKQWAPNDIIRLFKSPKTRTSLFRDEEKGLIPKAQRAQRGKTQVRVWATTDLPEIGKYYGFLKSPQEPKIISVYTPKGGVLKSTLAFNLSRVLAINGIKVLVIGLDVQGTITHNLCHESEINSISDIQEREGLYDLVKKDNKCSFESVIKTTDLPTLSYIPETSTLNFLEQLIRDEHRREQVLDRILKPLYKDFDVVIFDNAPNWNFLILNSLVAATDVICPIACDIETYRSLTQNINMINDFKEKMDLNWSNFILIPTKVARTKLSTQIEAEYRREFPDFITAGSIRDAAVGQESSLAQLSVIECVPTSQLADDYYHVLSDIWTRITSESPRKTTKVAQDNSIALEA